MLALLAGVSPVKKERTILAKAALALRGHE
jgi:hypothetical protein